MNTYLLSLMNDLKTALLEDRTEQATHVAQKIAMNLIEAELSGLQKLNPELYSFVVHGSTIKILEQARHTLCLDNWESENLTRNKAS